MSNEPKKTRAPRALRLTVPESLAREIRRLAEVSRRPVQEVATAVLGAEVFGGITAERVRELWLKHLQAEVAGPSGGTTTQ